MWRQDDEKEATTETDKPPEPMVAVERSKETKEGEKEDLITRFDRLVRGESDNSVQV